MDNLFPTWPGRPDGQQQNDDNRLLKRLRIALAFWFVALLLTAIWFSNSPAF